MVYGVGDVMPTVTHVTTPARFRGRRPGVLVHRAPLPTADRAVRDSVPVTAIERTLSDVAETSDPSLAQQATREALDRGLTTRMQLNEYLRGRDQARAIIGRERRRRVVG